MTQAATILLCMVTFLAAAKSHGRQLRLERELAGHWSVTFGSSGNPPFVEALWRRERVLFWSSLAAIELVTVALRWVIEPGSGLLLHGFVPVIGAFIVTGLISFARLIRDVRKATPKPEWWSDALRGTVRWWMFTFALLGILGEIRS